MLQQLSVEGSQLQLCVGEELHYSGYATYPKLVIKNTQWSVSLDNQIIYLISPPYQVGLICGQILWRIRVTLP